MRYAVLVLLLLSVSAPARAEWQFKPFVGMTFGGGTNFVGDWENAVGKRKSSVGVSTAVLGEVLGVEANLGYGSSFFNDPKQGRIAKGSLTTFTGNVMVALPRRIAEYTLRPYFVAGAGVIHASTTTSPVNVFELHRNLPALDVGAGVTGFVTRKVGVSWEVRHFRDLKGTTALPGSTIDGLGERISFWRANMALAIRY